MKNFNPLLTGLCLLLSTQTAFAEKHKMEQHGSHEHGVARLTVATTDHGLEIALESPAANLFGFEHKASTKAEKDVVHEAIEKLEVGSSLFAMNEAAGCSFDTANVEAAMADSHDDHEDKKHDDHKDEKHDDHKDEKESHSDVDVTWNFKCEKPAAINSISTKLFSAFPNGFEELAVEWITANNAGKTELKKDDTITLKQ